MAIRRREGVGRLGVVVMLVVVLLALSANLRVALSSFFLSDISAVNTSTDKNNSPPTFLNKSLEEDEEHDAPVMNSSRTTRQEWERSVSSPPWTQTPASAASSLVLMEKNHNSSFLIPWGPRNTSTFQVSPDKFLLYILPTRPGGFSDQIGCWHIAGNLAIQYNRTLRVGSVGYKGNHLHDGNYLMLTDLFQHIRVPYKIVRHGKYLLKPFVKRKFPKLVYDANAWEPEGLWNDAHVNDTIVWMECSGSYETRLLDPLHFPHVDQVLFPYHERHWRKAQQVVEEMKRRTIGAAMGMPSAHADFRYLGLQIRLGDRGVTAPLLTCEESLQYQYNPITNQTYDTYCNTSTTSATRKRHRIKWYQYLPRAICQLSLDYQAIFVATTNRGFVQQMYNTTDCKPQNVFFLQDLEVFPSNQTSSESVERFVVELLILVMSDLSITSIPTSITAQLLKLRLTQQPNQRDVELSKIYRHHLAASKINWRR